MPASKRRAASKAKHAMKARKKAPKNIYDIVRIVCCSNLLTGMTAELNLLSGGNGAFMVGAHGNGRCLREGGIYDVRMTFFPFNNDDADRFRPDGTILRARAVSKARFKKLRTNPSLIMNIDEP